MILFTIVVFNLILFFSLQRNGFPTHQVPDYWDPKTKSVGESNSSNTESEATQTSLFNEIFFNLFTLFGLIFYLSYICLKNLSLDSEFSKVSKNALLEKSDSSFQVGNSVILPQEDGTSKICEIMNVIIIRENNQKVKVYQILAYDPDFILKHRFWTGSQFKTIPSQTLV